MKPKPWSRKRKRELEELQALLRDVARLNNSSGAMDLAKDCARRANRLLSGDFDKGLVGLAQFLVYVAIGRGEEVR